MKSNMLFITILGVIMSCQKTEEVRQTENDKIRDYLCNQLNCHNDQITETDSSFVFEGCTVFPKENFWEEYGPSETTNPGQVEDRSHRKHNFIVNSNTTEITIVILPAVSGVWHSAINKAAQEWNALDGQFSFKVVYRSNPLIGAINIDSYAGNYGQKVAMATYPNSSGDPGSKIHINSFYNYISYNYKVFTIIHEIGHSLGFRHTNTTEGSALTTGNATCDNHPDSYSVFRDILRPWVEFSYCDAYAYYELYPN
jgi:hypothetical protein